MQQIDGACYARHTGGIWMMAETALSEMVGRFNMGVLKEYTEAELDDLHIRSLDILMTEHGGAIVKAAAPYLLTGNGVAIVDLQGPLMKQRSKFGGTSTVAAASAIQQAVRSNDVGSILLRVDSPGGTVSGIEALCHAVGEANVAKPVHAHADGICASAGYWPTSQARYISAAPMTQTGSIGTYATIVDSSEAAEKQGLKVHVVKAGAFKGAGEPGVPVDEDTIEEIQMKVDSANQYFLDGVAKGRDMSSEAVAAIADGRTHDSPDAYKLGLIDEINRFPEAVRDAAMAANDQTRPQRIAALDNRKRLRGI